MTPPSPHDTPVLIRPATKDDVPALLDLIEQFVQANRLLPRTGAELDELLPSGFVASIDDRLVGFAALEIYSPKLAEVRSLAVIPEMQSLGIGRLLVSRCVELARERSILEVMAITSADSFFQSCGFDFTLPGEKKALFISTGSPGQGGGVENG